jgi:hypothetical protein
VSAFEQAAIQRLVDKATAASVPVPSEVTAALERAGHGESSGADLWIAANPDQDKWPVEVWMCCLGVVDKGPSGCTCWTPVYDVEQAPPRPPFCAEDLAARARMCGDCAFRKGSPERSDVWAEEALMDLTWSAGTPFWCHDGLRRPAKWVHPTLGEVEGSTADWRPPIVAGIPYRADGAPGLLCAGWAARTARNAIQRNEEAS